MRWMVIGSMTALASMAVPSAALACSPACPTLVPLGTESDPVHLPANGVFVVPPYTSASEILVDRTRAGARETSSHAFEYGGILLTDVEAGDRLVVSVMSSCAGAMTSTVIDVTPAAPLPTQLGLLEVEASRRTLVAVWDNRGWCSSDLASTAAPFTVTFDESIEPWRDALVETTLVDDAPWWGPSDPRVAPRFVFTACEPRLESQMGGPDLPVGAHRLRVRGSLRGLEGTFDTNEESIHLSCDAGPSCAATPTQRPLDTTWMLGLGGLVTIALRSRRRRWVSVARASSLPRDHRGA